MHGSLIKFVLYVVSFMEDEKNAQNIQYKLQENAFEKICLS